MHNNQKQANYNKQKYDSYILSRKTLKSYRSLSQIDFLR